MPTVTKFDHHFKIYADIYFGGEITWQWFKAMAIAESNLAPKAVSPVGAKGIMQLMPRTSAEVARELWLKDDPFDPQINILMGIHYARKMWNVFKKEKGLDRLCFMFGAYNAGWKNIVRTQDVAARPDIWDDLVAVMPQVTGKHAMETIQYVERILAIRQEMIGVS
jgi:soluble lytic murein transglycosylase-like protein